MAGARLESLVYHRSVEAFVLRSPAGPVHRKVSSVTRKTAAIAKATAPVRKRNGGRLRNSEFDEVQDQVVRLRGLVEFRVFYAIFNAKGTGIYGPRGRRITAKNGGVLVFRGEDGTLVRTRSVSGQRPNPWMVNALKAASPWPVVVHE